MKVKKFRIKPRLPVVGRILKTIMGVKKLPPEIEESLPKELEDFLPHIVPTAFYQTWSAEDVPSPIQDILTRHKVEKTIAVSAVVATIGQTPDEYLSDVLMKGETRRSEVVMAFSEEAADLAFAFIFRLLIDDAHSDDCEISEPIPIEEAEALNEILALLEADQEGVFLDAAQHLTPRFSRVALSVWWTATKKKKTLPSNKKKTS